MTGWLGDTYLWMKAAHLIFVIFWMAGLFMLPRFFIYHQEAPEGSEESARWVDREDRLRKIIMTPSIIIVWVFGLMLAMDVDAFSQGWFYAKLLFVSILSGYHGWMVGYAKKLAKGERPLAGKTLRLLNEIPGVAAGFIVVAAIVKPF
jgi:protoporphyrinogen IX oxidase